MEPRPRVAYLDNLRVLLTVLVILHHVAASYSDVGVWYYQEPASGPGSAIFFMFLMAVNQAFFMGFFFLIGGYFVPPSLARKGAAAFVRERLLRLGVPLLLFFFVLNGLATRIGGRQPGWPLSPGPMWFAEILLLFTLVYTAVRRALPRLGPLRIDGRTTAALALVMGIGSFLIRTQMPVNVWLPFPTIQPAHATQYVCLFAVGVWASGSDLGGRIAPELARHWRTGMIVATFTVLAVFFAMGGATGSANLGALIGGWTWQSLAVSVWEQIFAVGMIVSLLRAFHARWNQAGPILSSAAASTYAVYVFHPIVVVAMAVALGGVALPSAAKFFVTAPIAVIVLFAMAPWVRRAPLLRDVL